MATYKDSGVDIELGDQCSKIAYTAAMETFPGRDGMLYRPVVDEGGFAGLIDMGEFFLVQNDDGVGTKMDVAERMKKFDTLGYDLIAMVADDAVCLGAEVISVTNTLDIPKLDKEMVEGLMTGLKNAALEQKIVIPGGELAELGDALNGAVWNATSIGVLNKHHLITGDSIKEGNAVIALKSEGIRSNGLSLARMILKKEYGDDWVKQDYGDGKTWGEVILTPSKIYHRALVKILGEYQFNEEPTVRSIFGLVHNTGGGIRGNLPRLLKKKGLGANLDSLPEPHEFMKKLQEMGNVSDEEAYKTWNMGVGMLAVINENAVDKVLGYLNNEGIDAVVAGTVTSGSDIKLSI